MSNRIIIGRLISLIVLLAVNCGIVSLFHFAPGGYDLLYVALLGFLPLINAALLGVLACLKGYRVRLRRKTAGQVPFWTRSGLISIVALLIALAACVAAQELLVAYGVLVADHLDRWLMGLGASNGPIFDGSLLSSVLFFWAFLSGPPLSAVCVISWISHRYTVTIEKTASQGIVFPDQP